MGTEHLGNKKEFIEFSKACWDEIQKHEHDKEPIRDWTIQEVHNMVVSQLSTRTETINENLKTDKELVKKNCLHVANYAMFLWLKLQGSKPSE